MCGRVNIIDALYAFFARFLNLPLQIETALNIGPTERVWALKQMVGCLKRFRCGGGSFLIGPMAPIKI